MKPYPRYKPTGLAWLPSVPEHWEMRQLKRMAKLKGGCGFPIDKQGKFNNRIRFIKVNALASKIDPHRTYDTISDSDVQTLNATVFKKGSIVFAKVGAALRLQRFEELPFDCCIDNNMMGIFDISENPKWLRYALSLLDFGRIVNPGAVPSVNQSQVGTMQLPLPPPSEQDRIVSYLDGKTAAIDELVRAKEREIDLLRERKQALVSAAVTGGLDPATERKDSGVPWIGKIPKGWNVVKLSRRYSVQLGKMLDAKKIKGQSLMPYLRNQDVQWEGVNSEDLPKMDFSAEEQVRFGVRKGDLLVCEGGEIGRCAIWDSDKPCCFQKAIIRLRPRKPAEDFVRFMWYLMFAATANHAFDFATGKATIAHLPAEKLSAAQFAFPPLPEQERIVAHLDSVCSELDAAEAAIRKQIALLQELRIRLVSDAVTGAVEVN